MQQLTYLCMLLLPVAAFSSKYFYGMDLFGSGGGIQILLSNISINNTTISNNETRFGGGIYISNSNGVLYNTTISNNYSDSKGGGLWIGGNSSIDLNKFLEILDSNLLSKMKKSLIRFILVPKI